MSDANPAPAATRGRANLTEGPIARTLLLFAMPMLAGNVLQSLNGSVNAIWVGHFLGEAALSATASANAILFFLVSSVLGVGMAGTLLVGQCLGAGDVAQAKRVVGTSVSFVMGLALPVAVLGYLFTPELLAAMHAPPAALPLATAYLRVLFLAMPMMFPFLYLSMLLRGAGDANTPFVFLVLAVVLDIALNPLLIFGVGPLPRLGIAGSAASTLIAQGISLAAMLARLYAKGHFLCLRRADLPLLRVDRAILSTLVRKGIPMGMQMVVVSLSMIMMMSLVNRYGAETAAAYGACLQLWNYVQMPAMAVGMGVSAMAAQNVGAGRWDRVRLVVGTGLAFNLAMTGGLVALIYLFNRAALGLFLPDHVAALPIAEHINAVVLWSWMLFGLTFVMSGVMRATGAVVPPLVILFIGLWLARVPFAYGLTDAWQADAIWWSFPFGSAVTVTLTYTYFRYGRWRDAHLLGTAATPAR